MMKSRSQRTLLSNGKGGKLDECFLSRRAECPVGDMLPLKSHLATEKGSKMCLF